MSVLEDMEQEDGPESDTKLSRGGYYAEPLDLCRATPAVEGLPHDRGREELTWEVITNLIL